MNSPDYSADRSLLVGVLALEMGFLSREQLIAGTVAWMRDKSQALDDVLEAQGFIDAQTHALLSQLVAKHLELHDNRPEKSLAAVGSLAEVAEELGRLGDEQIEATLARLDGASCRSDGPTVSHVSPAAPAGSPSPCPSPARGEGEFLAAASEAAKGEGLAADSEATIEHPSGTRPDELPSTLSYGGGPAEPGLPLPRAPAACPGRTGQGLGGHRRGTEPRGGLQGAAGPLRR